MEKKRTEIRRWDNGELIHSLPKPATIKDVAEDAAKKGLSLIRASLIRASLNGASLNWASLNGASLDGASLDGASLIRANLNRANLNGANLNGASLNGASLNWASLNGAKIEFARFPAINELQSFSHGRLPDSLCLELMLRDAWASPKPELFIAWIEGGGCPLDSIGRAWLFTESQEVLKGHLDQFDTNEAKIDSLRPRMRDSDLVLALCKEKGWGINNYLEAANGNQTNQ